MTKKEIEEVFTGGLKWKFDSCGAGFPYKLRYNNYIIELGKNITDAEDIVLLISYFTNKFVEVEIFRAKMPSDINGVVAIRKFIDDLIK